MKRRLAVVAALAFGLPALAGCLDLTLITEIAFAPTVPGLPPNQPWVTMPVNAWVTEGGVRAEAMAGCFAEACTPRAAVGVFRADGSDAAAVARVLADPELLARFLAEPEKRPRRMTARSKPASPAPVRRAAVSVQRLAAGTGPGFVLRMAQADGSRPAFGVVVARPRGGGTSFVLVVSGSEDAARRLAADVAARLG